MTDDGLLVSAQSAFPVPLALSEERSQRASASAESSYVRDPDALFLADRERQFGHESGAGGQNGDVFADTSYAEAERKS